jgi:hypothetical protein
MDRFIINKRKLDDDTEPSVADASSGSVGSETVVSQYNDYLSFGFISLEKSSHV